MAQFNPCTFYIGDKTYNYDEFRSHLFEGGLEKLLPDFKAARQAPTPKPDVAGEAEPLTVPKEYGAKNTNFTRDKAEAAKAHLLKKFGKDSNVLPNLGGALENLDAATIKAIADVAGFHIEAGARSFAAFSKAMIDEFGNTIKPHLEKIYGMVREAHKFEGMDEPKLAEPTSTKNAVANAERQSQGKSTLNAPEPKPFTEIRTNVQETVKNNPDAPRDLVDQLLRDPRRAVNDEETDLLLYRKIELRKQYNVLAKDLVAANETGDPLAIDIAQRRLGPVSESLDKVNQVINTAGTATARGLAARRMMADEDFSLASLQLQKRAAVGGRNLTPTEMADLSKVAEDYKAKAEALEKRLAEIEGEKKDETANRYFEHLFKSVDKEKRAAQKKGVGIISFAESLETKAYARIKARGDRGAILRAGGDPAELAQMLADHAIIGAAEIARGVRDVKDWSKSMIDKFGEKIKPYLGDLWKQSNEFYDKHISSLDVRGKTPEDIVAKASEKALNEIKAENLLLTDEQAQAKFKAEQKGLVPEKALVGQLVEAHVRAGTTDLGEVIAAVKKDLAEVYPDATERDIRDAFSDYGKVKYPSADEAKQKVAELRRLSQLTSAIEDANIGKAPQKTGFQRGQPTQSIRDKMKELDEAMRAAGIEPSEADQLASVNRARETSLRNQIEDLERQIATGIKPAKGEPVAASETVKELRKKRDELKAQLPKESTQMSLETKQRLYKQNLERQIEKLETQIKTGEAPVKGQKVPTTAEIDALKAKRDALKAQLPEVDRSISDARKLEIRQKAIQKRMVELKAKIATGDFTRTPRKTTELDRKTLGMQAELETVKRDFNRGIKANELANRTKPQKAQDLAVRLRRAFVLSGMSVIEKLTAAATSRFITSPVEALIEHGYGAVLPGVAKRMGREYGFRVKAEAKAITDAFMRGLPDAVKTLQMKQSEIEAVYGKPEIGPRSHLEFFGALHGALKAPTKRAAFARDFELRMRRAIADGLDPADPLVQMAVGLESYKAGNRSIFMQDNFVTNWWQTGIRTLERKGKDGKVDPSAKGLATLLRILLPIVKIPTNFVGETVKYTAGVPVGAGKAALAYKRGIESLAPEDAELITRWLKKGSIGAVGLTLGALFPSAIGGYYQGKRDPKDVPVGGIRIGGVDLPRILLHNPLLETLQIGATFRRVMDSKLKKSDEENQGVTMGLLAATLGLVGEVPLVKENEDISKLMDSKERGKFTDDFIKNLIVPQGLQQIAAYLDKTGDWKKWLPHGGEPIKRKPEGLFQTIESGIPGLRKNVPAVEGDKGRVSDEAKQAQLKTARVTKEFDLIEQADAKGEDATDVKESLVDKLTRKMKAGTLTNAEAERANRLLDTDEYEGQVEDAEKPDIGRYNKNADGVIDKIVTWAEAVGTDPLDAFDKFFKGESIRRMENGAIIVKRMDKSASEAERKRLGGGGKAVKLDHFESLELGGTNAQSNLRLVTTEEWADYTPVENYLATALHNGVITGTEARQMIRDYKNKVIDRQAIVNRVGPPMPASAGDGKPRIPKPTFKIPALRMPSLK